MALAIPDPGGVGAGIAGAIGSVAAGVAGAVGSAASSVIPGVDQLGDVADTARAVRAWVSNRHNWTRVAWFAGGSVMFTVGALMVGERPIATATTAVVQPVGKVVKSAYKG